MALDHTELVPDRGDHRICLQVGQALSPPPHGASPPLLPCRGPPPKRRHLTPPPPPRLGRSRIVPEYSFLDPRGLGAYEGQDAASSLEAVYAADRESYLTRPPRTYDGTPNESVGV